jgi:hypothetical protein
LTPTTTAKTRATSATAAAARATIPGVEVKALTPQG